MKVLKLPRLVYNWTSTAGFFVAVISALLMVVMFGISLFEKETNPYFGVFLYMVLPPILLVGVILIPIGMYRQWRRERRTGQVAYPKWPYVDLNKRSHRNATAVFFFGTLIFLLLMAVGSYEAFHYSESVNFCGRTCHTVMKPEYTAYRNSPHARVPCVACHVGPGAGWYAKSKLSGAYQVYAVLANVYPRPIPTPIVNLRPAQETCEQCHWPEKFFGGVQRVFNHWMYDSANSPWSIDMLIKVGGGDIKTGQTSGIHWHMNIGKRVEYIARDEKRQDLPWVSATDLRTGEVTVYQDIANPLPDSVIAASLPRKMDCVDCHNRPSHIFRSPDFTIDQALSTGHVNHTLPNIKAVAVKAMAVEYPTSAAADSGIAALIGSYYSEQYPELYASRRAAIDSAIAATRATFAVSIFPEMKTRWSHYPDNIGHFINPGCMRCHLGNHQSADGRTITHDCTTCHTILSQGPGDNPEVATSQAGLEFKHPVDISEAWRETGCYECHSGVQP